MATTHFFISDTHFWHDNIIKYCNRPFKDGNEMTFIMRDRWNAVVKPSDHIYHLGDVTMLRGSSAGDEATRLIEFIHTLNGHKRLILGNHDHFPANVYARAGFEKIKSSDVRKMPDGKGTILFTHIPIHPLSMGRHAANVHGHTHNVPNYAKVARPKYEKLWEGKEWPEPGFSPYINISVEHTNYTPISLEEIHSLIKKAL